MKESNLLSGSLKFSVVIPVFNEADNLKTLHTRLTDVMSGLREPYEIIYVDDGSTDGSFQILKELHQEDSRVKIISFTRNFGQHIAITAGLDHSKGENVILMDADLQDKPEEIPKLLAKLREGYDIVYGHRNQRQDSFFKKITSKVYLSLLSKLTNETINPEISPFRIMTRRVVDYFNQFRERSRFYGGLVAWLGFPYAIVPVEHSERFSGKTKYNLAGMVKLGIEGIISFSDIPLRLIGRFGLLVSALSFIIGIYYLLVWIINGIPTPGYTSMIVSIFFMGGIQLIVLGIISRYIGNIHLEIKKRPLYVIKDKIE
ncbi:MAG TPA: glycosyltransferase family 2 protein [Anaerolineales bacterium]|nr:glycosyltransferase family 2 protein [Anaerolineales bacterium]